MEAKNQSLRKYIDCIRGYAILMVITCHLVYEFPEMPYPIHRLLVTGWFGVQLFFLASCITLLQSWNSELRRNKSVSIVNFFLRRLFRIAPAYYVFALIYGYMQLPVGGFSSLNIASTFLFLGGLYPTGGVGHNSIVPGGWSIGTEFAFYAVFPVFAHFCNSLRRALFIFVLSLVVGIIANVVAFSGLSEAIKFDDLNNGLFFWFPNQFCIFSLGGIVYHIVKSDAGVSLIRVKRFSGTVVAGTFGVFCLLAYVPLGKWLGDSLAVPAMLAVSACFCIAIVAMSTESTVFVNGVSAAIGKVSFSAYLVHWLVLQFVKANPVIFYTHSNGIKVVVAYALTWLIVVGVTYCISWLVYRGIETPAINMGKSIIDARRLGRVGMSAGGS